MVKSCTQLSTLRLRLSPYSRVWADENGYAADILMSLQTFIASWFGSGLLLGKIRGSHAGSGSVSSVVAMGMVWYSNGFGWQVTLALAGAITLLSIWSSAPFTEDGDDPGWVVVDEVAGMFVAGIGLFGMPLLVAFLVFRVADITKAFPGVGWADRRHGPVGVTLDDLISGAYGLAAGWLFTLI